MKVIKLGLISIFFFSLLLLMISLLFPSQVRVSRAINIDAPKAHVAQQLTDLNTWKEWNSLSVGSNIKIISVDSQAVVSEWSHAAKSVTGVFRFEESAGVTVVQWYFDFRVRWYPWEKFGSITFDAQFGPEMETSLNNLKNRLENSP